jgi:hypothetical protein
MSDPNAIRLFFLASAPRAFQHAEEAFEQAQRFVAGMEKDGVPKDILPMAQVRESGCGRCSTAAFRRCRWRIERTLTCYHVMNEGRDQFTTTNSRA